MRDLFDFYVSSHFERRFSLRDILILEIQNRRKNEIQDIAIKVPGVHEVSKITALSGSLPPDKITKLEGSWSLNKQSHTLFLNHIEQLPSLAVLRIYIHGNLTTFFPHELRVTFKGGVSKVIDLHRIDPSAELSLLQRIYGPRWASWQVFLISAVLVLVLYLIFLIKGNKKEK